MIPVFGQLDDLAVAFAALRFALAGLDAERRHEHLASVGLADDDLTEDLATMGAITVWTVRAGARTTRRAAVKGGQMVASGARAAGDATAAGAVKVSPHLRQVTEPITRRAAAATPDAVKHAGKKAGPAARSMADRLTPTAVAAATRMGSAVRGAASRGASLVGAPASKASGPVPGRRARPAPAEERLRTEPDLLDGRDSPG